MSGVGVAKVAQILDLCNFIPQMELKGHRIMIRDVNRPALQLSGYFEHFEQSRVQIIGTVEYTYLQQLDEKKKEAIYREFMAYDIPCVIFCRDLKPDEMFLKIAEESNLPVFGTKRSTSEFMAELIYCLSEQLAPCITIHGVLVDVYGEGLLIMGESGIGKSEAALELLKRGHRLIADDAVDIRKVNSNSLVGSAPELIRNYIELRGIGIVNVAKLFGMGSVRSRKSIDLVVNIVPWNNQDAYDRLGLEEQYMEILGVKIPMNTIPITPGRNLAVILEVAAINVRQRKLGYNAAQEFTDQINRHFAEMEGNRP